MGHFRIDIVIFDYHWFNFINSRQPLFGVCASACVSEVLAGWDELTWDTFRNGDGRGLLATETKL